jgi:hypothetical protein
VEEKMKHSRQANEVQTKAAARAFGRGDGWAAESDHGLLIGQAAKSAERDPNRDFKTRVAEEGNRAGTQG